MNHIYYIYIYIYRYPLPFFTTLICLICVIVFIYELILNKEKVNAQLILGLSIRECILKLRLWELITNVFTHANLEHLVGNMIVHLIVGARVENLYGSLFYIYMTLVLILILDVLELFNELLLGLFVDREFYNVPSLGYSGVICGFLMLAFTQLDKCRVQCFWKIFSCNILWLPILFVFIQVPSLIQMYTQMQNAKDAETLIPPESNVSLLLQLVIAVYMSTYSRIYIYIYIFIVHLSGAIIGLVLLKKYGIYVRGKHFTYMEYDEALEYVFTSEECRRNMGFIRTNTSFLRIEIIAEVREPLIQPLEPRRA